MPCRCLAAVGLAVLVWVFSAQQADGAKARTPAHAPTQTQAALPAGERDYARAAGIAGYGRREYEALDAHGQQVARREIDQELAVRKGANVAAREVAASGESSLKPREQEKVDKQFGQKLEQEVNAEGHELPTSLKPRPKRPSFDTHQRDWRSGGSNGGSPLVRDAHEMRRKRQLGRERRR